jgi:c(7)-type cytochrome triheme protein
MDSEFPRAFAWHVSCIRIHMRTLIVCFISICLTAGFAISQDKKAPDKLTFNAKNGNVTFDHAAHVKAAKNDCKTCHDKLFKEDNSAPLNFKPAMHKTAEAEKTSCGACHNAGGPSFESKGNCGKCHVKTT